jgi:hypothetical protein
VSADLYVRDGSRFVLYDERAQHTPPIPVPTPNGPSPERPVVEVRPGVFEVYAPICPHGHYRGCRRRGCPGPS